MIKHGDTSHACSELSHKMEANFKRIKASTECEITDNEVEMLRTECFPFSHRQSKLVLLYHDYDCPITMFLLLSP